MTEEEIRESIAEAIHNFFEEESGFATTDLSGLDGGESIGVPNSDPSYMYRPKIGKVQQRPYPSLIGMDAPKKKKIKTPKPTE